jgi:hypothetical protein
MDSGAGARDPSAWRGRLAAWLAWCGVVFVVFNAGASHDAGAPARPATLAEAPAWALARLRFHLRDDPDLLRYHAYCNAMLGRATSSDLVQPIGAPAGAGTARQEASPDPGRESPHPMLPYRDFRAEYPPGFFLWTLPVAWAARSLDAFRLLFGTMMGLTLTLALALSLAIARCLSPAAQPERVVALSAAGALLLGTVTTHRFDAAVSLSLIGAGWAAFRERPVWLGLFIGVGTVSKLVPALGAPFFFLYLLRHSRFEKVLLAAVVAVGSACAIGLAPLAWGGQLADAVAYHRDRPLHLESTYSAALGLLRAAGGPSVGFVHSYGSSNATGAAAESCARIAALVSLAGLALVLVWIGRRVWVAPSIEESRVAALAGTAAALVVFMVAGKVFSPQYLVWLLPLGILLAQARGGASLGALLATWALTQLIYSVIYPKVEVLHPMASALVFARNALLAWWGLHLLVAPRDRRTASVPALG